MSGATSTPATPTPATSPPPKPSDRQVLCTTWLQELAGELPGSQPAAPPDSALIDLLVKRRGGDRESDQATLKNTGVAPLIGAILKDDDRSTKTKESAQARLEQWKKKYDLVRNEPRVSQDPKLGNAIVDGLYQEVSTLLNNDLAKPEFRASLFEKQERFEATVNQACSTARPGLSAIADHLLSLESHPNFEFAEKIDASVRQSFNDLWTNAGTMGTATPNLNETMKSIKQLEIKCTNLTRDYTALQEEIRAREAAVREARTSIFKTKPALPPAAVQFFTNEFLKLDAQLSEARMVAPVSMTGQTADQKKTAYDTVHSSVRTLLTTVDRGLHAIDQAKQSLLAAPSGTASTSQPAIATADKAKFLSAKQTFETYFAAANGKITLEPIASTYANELATTTLDQCTWSALEIDNRFQSAVKLRDSFLKYWSELKQKVFPGVRAAEQVVASCSINEQEELQDIDSRQATVKARVDSANALLDAYHEAIDHAKQGEYLTAVQGLERLLSNDCATILQNKKQAIANFNLDEATLQKRSEVFATYMGETTKKGKIRFSHDEIALMMGLGAYAHLDGSSEMSEQAKQMANVMQEAVEKWRELESQGVDPFKAADLAFQGIPENYWPPEAVQSIAMFRRAEGDLQAEREAAELEELLSKGLLDKGKEKIQKLFENQVVENGKLVGGTVTELFPDAVDVTFTIMETIVMPKMEQMRENFAGSKPGLSEEDYEEELREAACASLGISASALESAGNVLGALSSGLAIIKTEFDIVTHVKELAEAQIGTMTYNPETDSPVQLKIKEFERAKAIFQLVNSIVDLGLNVTATASEFVPILGEVTGLVSELKSLGEEVYQAQDYFRRLAKVSTLKTGASYDPDTMMDLSLAREAEKLGMLGAEKTFEAVTAAIQAFGSATSLVGEFTQAGDFGATKLSGFTIKLGGKALGFGGSICFYFKTKADDARAKSTLLAAKADPTNILLVEPVFEQVTLYSRMSLAMAAMAGDTWARQYLLARGLTDTDLDNVNTSAAIIREYLNVTFQNKQYGEAEEDDDFGIGKEEDQQRRDRKTEEMGSDRDALRRKLDDIRKKIAEGDRSTETAKIESLLSEQLYGSATGSTTPVEPSEREFYGDWEPAAIVLDAQNFRDQCNLAKAKQFLWVKQQINDAADAITKFATAKGEADQQMQLYENKLAEAKSSDYQDPSKCELAINARNEAMRSISELGNRLSELGSALNFTPLATAKDRSGKNFTYEPMVRYLKELAESAGWQYRAALEFRNRSDYELVSLENQINLMDSANHEENIKLARQKLREKFSSANPSDLTKLIESIRTELGIENDDSLKPDGLMAKKIDAFAIQTRFGKTTVEQLMTFLKTHLSMSDVELQAIKTQWGLHQKNLVVSTLRSVTDIAKKLETEQQTVLARLAKRSPNADPTALANAAAPLIASKQTQLIQKEIFPLIETFLQRGPALITEKMIDSLYEKAKLPPSTSGTNPPPPAGAVNYQQLETACDSLVTEIGTDKALAEWEKCKVEMSKFGWKAKDQLYTPLEKLAEAKSAFDQLQADGILQAEYRTAISALNEAITKQSFQNALKVVVPGCNKLTQKMRAKTLALHKDLETTCSDPNFPLMMKDGQWVPSDDQIRRLHLTAEGLKFFEKLAKKHGWKGDRLLFDVDFTKLFRTMHSVVEVYKNMPTTDPNRTEAKRKADTAVQTLIDRMTNWNPNKKTLRIGRAQVFPAMDTYKRVSVERLAAWKSGGYVNSL